MYPHRIFIASAILLCSFHQLRPTSLRTVLWYCSARGCRPMPGRPHQTVQSSLTTKRRIMKPIYKKKTPPIYPHLLVRCAIIIPYILMLFSCEKTEFCEEDNSGTLVIENSRTTGIVKLYFNTEPRAANSAGDISILPGETVRHAQPAGQVIIYAILNNSDCNGNRCSVRNQALPTRTVDLDTCEESNLVY